MLVGGAVAGIAVVVGLVFGGIYLFGGISNHTANFRGEVAKKNLVEANGAFRTAAYDHFFDLCAAVQDDEAQIDSLNVELKSDPPPTPERISQIQQNLTALRANRAVDINQYNVDTQKGYTEGQFKADGLPFHLSASDKETRCTS